MRERTLLTVCLSGLLVLFLLVPGYAAERQFRIGMMWNVYSDQGREGWGGTSMTWPGGDWPKDKRKDTASYRAYNMAVADWTKPIDTAAGAAGHYDHYVHQADIRGRAANEIYPKYVKLISRYPPPVVTVDGEDASLAATPDEIDPNLVSDQMIISEWNTILDIQVHRECYAYVNPKYDDLNIMHYVFKNISGTAEALGPAQDIHQFWYNQQDWFMDRAEGGRHYGQVAEWSGDAHIAFYAGGPPGSPSYNEWKATGHVPEGSLRFMYGWDGDGSNYPVDDTGDPDMSNGRFLSAKYPGVGILHIDKSVTDRSNDWDQPQTFTYMNWAKLPQTWTMGHDPGWQMITSRERWDPNPSPPDKGDYIGPCSVISYGPKEIPVGEEIHMWFVEGVGGMPYQETVEKGWKYHIGEMTDAEKNALMASLLDTLINVMAAAREAYENGMDVPDGPPPPSEFTVTSVHGGIDLSWAPLTEDQKKDIDTGVNDFAGYRVYRAKESYLGDQPFVKIYEGTDTSFQDRTAGFGTPYYYYVVAYDNDGLESSMWLTRTRVPAVAVPTPNASLSKGSVRVVPNPWDSRKIGLTYHYGGMNLLSMEGDINNDVFNTIRFYNIPETCTIRIYTAAGDLVKEIKHEPGGQTPSGSESWDLTNEQGQRIRSGIYIFTVEGADGKTDVGKFVVIR